VIAALTTAMPRHFDVAEGDVRLAGAVISLDSSTGKAKSIERVMEFVAPPV
jgi:calcineurin-like phosphoesterase